MNNVKLLLGAVIVLVVVSIGGYFILGKKESKTQTTSTQIQEDVVRTISPEELGLTVTLREDKRAIKFSIENAGDIATIDYQISYTKEINGEEVPEGLIGQVEVDPTDDTVGINYREFGTCSSGVCRYDKVVSSVNLTLKIIKQNGKTYSLEETIEL